MYEKATHALSRNRHYAASSRPVATKRGRSLKVELLFGGISLLGCLEYDAKADRVTFTLKKNASSPPDEL